MEFSKNPESHNPNTEGILERFQIISISTKKEAWIRHAFLQIGNSNVQPFLLKADLISNMVNNEASRIAKSACSMPNGKLKCVSNYCSKLCSQKISRKLEIKSHELRVEIISNGLIMSKNRKCSKIISNYIQKGLVLLQIRTRKRTL